MDGAPRQGGGKRKLGNEMCRTLDEQEGDDAVTKTSYLQGALALGVCRLERCSEEGQQEGLVLGKRSALILAAPKD